MKGTIVSSLVAVLALALASSVSASPYPLSEILKKEEAAKLAKEKVTTSDELLERAAKPKDRRALAKATGLKVPQLLAWARMCDLLRIKGVGPEMVQLLKAGRVTMVKQLRAQKAGPLHKRLIGVNKKKKITENPPTKEQLDAWIGEAKKLKLVLR
jgi:predicted flap endonuclease-1-like 5' DNA nuclease